MKLLLLALIVTSLGAIAWAETAVHSPMLKLHTRGLKPPNAEGEKFTRFEKTEEWNPQRTALIVVDMWDDHWCRGAAERVVEMAGPLNEFVSKARDAGVLVVHAPSTCRRSPRAPRL